MHVNLNYGSSFLMCHSFHDIMISKSRKKMEDIYDDDNNSEDPIIIGWDS